MPTLSSPVIPQVAANGQWRQSWRHDNSRPSVAFISSWGYPTGILNSNLVRPQHPFQVSTRFENLHKTRQWYCRALCKISPRCDNWAMIYKQTSFSRYFGARCVSDGTPDHSYIAPDPCIERRDALCCAFADCVTQYLGGFSRHRGEPWISHPPTLAPLSTLKVPQNLTGSRRPFCLTTKNEFDIFNSQTSLDKSCLNFIINVVSADGPTLLYAKASADAGTHCVYRLLELEKIRLKVALDGLK